jgi:4-methylaminobutanoate oxidase (formaldehyde-forming)
MNGGEEYFMIPNEANIVVIGGGVIGTSAAFHLAAAGYQQIVLLDRGPLASGTTPFAAGQTAYLPSKKHLLPFTTYCMEFFEHFVDYTGYPIHFHQYGSLRVVLTEQYFPTLDTRMEAARQLGNKVELITPRQAKELVPALEVSDAKGILFMPRDGYVEPQSVAAGYAAGARDRGVAIYTRTPVTGIEIVDGAVRAVRTVVGTIRTRWVVLAIGAWTRQFTQHLGLNIKTVPVRHQAFVTVPLTGVSARQPVVRIVEPQIYARPEAGGLLVGGYGYRPLSFDMDTFPNDFAVSDLEADQIYYHQLAEAAAQFFPVLRQAVIIQERRGLPTITPDGQYLVSAVPQVKGLIVASGCMVGGIFASPGLGRIVADIVSGKESTLSATLFQADRFGDDYAHDAALRSQCERVYACHYWDIYR